MFRISENADRSYGRRKANVGTIHRQYFVRRSNVVEERFQRSLFGTRIRRYFSRTVGSIQIYVDLRTRYGFGFSAEI